MASPHVIKVRFDGGPRHGRTIDLVITGHVPLMLSGQPGSTGLYELRCTEGRGTRYTWIDDLPVRR
ncbi:MULTISPECIES: hypothetical protein [Streptomyces]|uniref:Uncharacterized protein n=3 Tax=Streptomyces TaxID=1883 RepID=A0A1I6TFL2_9ACTN|nr:MULTISPECIES: hypothetical protein [Streptomyces]MCK1816522.1 hypothetical protein [Streptomyces sp. XM4011]QKV69500.1 hypothetical protein HUT13_12430 [Streptomyces harbinensis]UWM49893.1 hypothetical protein N0X72_13220 [Streptomyces carpaticus]SFS87965.1 hypothetical protein SAMN05444716_104617 [Streptomyces harbinensis]